MKVIAFYLPQFHTIPENDEWWGKGFTEWTNVKAAKPLFKNHYQPRIPLNNNYYNLLDDDIKIWQVELAKKYGIYGFCYYHYWYNGHLLLEKPMEQMLANKSIDLPFCIAWCNQPWTKSWVGNDQKVLISQTYGDKNEWVNHYNYLSKFFKDDRYIFKDNKPLILIYRPDIIKSMTEIIKFWNELAQKDGFKGLTFAGVANSHNMINENYELFDYIIDKEPGIYWNTIYESNHTILRKQMKKVWNKLNVTCEYVFGKDLNNFQVLNKLKTFFNNDNNHAGPKIYDDYSLMLKRILTIKPLTSKSIPSVFSDWDNTPRYKNRGSVINNVSTEVFKDFFEKFLIKTKDEYKQDMIFFVAWNEWAEGSVLEPDEKYQYGFLEAIRDGLIKLNEFPN